MRVFKGLLSFTAVLALSGCIESSGPSDYQVSADQTRSVVTQYARALEQHALLAQANMADEVQARFAAGEALPSFSEVTITGDGQFNEHLASFYCVDPAHSNRATLYTWFNTATSDGEFKLQGLGTDSGGAVLSALSNSVSASHIGLYKEGAIKYANASAAAALPSGCALDIPDNSPVISFDIDVTPPTNVASTVHKYRTVQCPEGEVGHIVQKSTVQRFPNGNEVQSAWVDDIVSCEVRASADMIEATTSSMSALDSDSVIAAVGTASKAGNILRERLGEVECRNAEQVAFEEDHASEDAKGAGSKGKHQRKSFSTCGQGEAINNLEDMASKYDIVIEVQEESRSCGGVSGSHHTDFRGYDALVSYPQWDGEERYSREIHRYILDNEHTDSTSDAAEERVFRGAWEGVSIQCERPEELHITCDEAFPALADYQKVASANHGYNYIRLNVIDGWADPVSVVPNEPRNPSWAFDAGNSGCTWRQTKVQDIGCPSGTTGFKTEYLESYLTIDSLDSTALWSSWKVYATTDNCVQNEGGGSADCGGCGGDPGVGCPF